ncbi:hypothetical protein [Jeongeupia naejangsanensis]|uniref:Uncharacterized protein n=1 Tax=Jeongeupia naejangsanensis TaxID=613195 RepID=A0ABS2BHQ3_9NEIS|nr:hypothetical protein [Jeongeupia naejangsanensis]MBM3115127.1 hypothetical protein [Jeongeupia naejangsanensis]
MQQRTPRPARLAPRQTLNLAVYPGDVLHVVHGRVSMIAAPQWLAETLLACEQPLRRGEHWHFERNGYVTLRTDDEGAQLMYRPAEPQPPRPGVHAWSWLWAFWRGSKRPA